MTADIMEGLTPGRELLSATAIEKNSSTEVTRIKKGLWGKNERMFPEQGEKKLPANR